MGTIHHKRKEDHCMGMISQMFERLDTGVLSELLLYGTSTSVASDDTCEQRMRESTKEFLEKYNALGLDPHLAEDITDIFYVHQGETNDIYFEVGMKAGIALYRKLVEGIPADALSAIDNAVG